MEATCQYGLCTLIERWRLLTVVGGFLNLGSGKGIKRLVLAISFRSSLPSAHSHQLTMSQKTHLNVFNCSAWATSSRG